MARKRRFRTGVALAAGWADGAYVRRIERSELCETPTFLVSLAYFCPEPV
jgi:hypothetical protein